MYRVVYSEGLKRSFRTRNGFVHAASLLTWAAKEVLNSIDFLRRSLMLIPRLTYQLASFVHDQKD